MRKWINYVDLETVDIYPIQFANSDRLLRHDAVYIFDEVGCGKTISSGIIAMDYLENNPEKKVLVITTNTLKKTYSNHEYGQFLDDWYNKLPFKQFGYEERISIENNHYSNFKNEVKYGLVIIDEAQLFWNKNTKRTWNLINNVRAEKVVILTATPIKGSENDLSKYIDIADAITEKKNDKSWIEKINTSNKTKEELICSLFDISYPVTRYFKDTMMSLNIEGFKKRKARRCLPHIWKYCQSNYKKDDVLLKNINEILEEDEKSKFVIFTRYVDKEAYKIEEFLIKNGFVKFNQDVTGVKSVTVVTGENAYELKRFSGIEGLPTVLVLTYQIAEQGVNLPGFNYVINYHIPAFPSALEQRFGRIDRMGKNGSVFEKINICFLISDENLDSNTANFVRAVLKYMDNIISYLPSKNIILSKEMLEVCIEKKNLINTYIKEIEETLTEENIIKLEKYLNYRNDRDSENIPEILLDFILEQDIKEDIITTKDLKVNIKEKLRQVKNELTSLPIEIIKKYKEIIEMVGDNIFYRSGGEKYINTIDENEFREIISQNRRYNKYVEKLKENLKTMDAVECGEIISRNKKYNEYVEKFKKEVKLPIVISNYQKEINQYYEKAFMNNEFDILFPFGEDKGIQDVVNKININKQDRELLLSNAEIVKERLPFYKMCNEFKKIIQRYDSMITFHSNPFTSAMEILGNKIRNSINKMGLTDEFVNEYWSATDGSYPERYNKFFSIDQKLDGFIEASNWYKLAYFYTRREERYFKCRSGDIPQLRIRKLRFIDSFYRLIDLWDPYYYKKSNDNEFREDEVKLCNKYYKYNITLNHELVTHFKDDKAQRGKDYTSLFFYYLFRPSGGKRSYVLAQACNLTQTYNSPKVNSNDIWTRRIYYEICGFKII
ncbi:MAG: helicase-related protein [Clostridia bacterium]|nr:helicase-related protein [Clostridia bacterium]